MGRLQKNHMMALMAAATRPMAPAAIERVLVMPPLTFGERERNIPSAPKKMATQARIKPRMAPLVKLRIAVISAMMDGMLNDRDALLIRR